MMMFAIAMKQGIKTNACCKQNHSNFKCVVIYQFDTEHGQAGQEQR